MTKARNLKIQAIAAVTAMLLVSFMVVRTSSAAFNHTIDGGAESFDASTVYFDDFGDTNFDIGDGLIPGDVVLECVDVTYAGTEFDSINNVLVEVTGLTGTNGTLAIADTLGIADGGTTLVNDALLNVVVGTAGTACSTLETELDTTLDINGLLADASLTNGSELYDGTLAAFEDSATDSGWAPASGDATRAFAFRIVLPADATNQSQGDSATGTFAWTVTAG